MMSLVEPENLLQRKKEEYIDVCLSSKCKQFSSPILFKICTVPSLPVCSAPVHTAPCMVQLKGEAQSREFLSSGHPCFAFSP